MEDDRLGSDGICTRQLTHLGEYDYDGEIEKVHALFS